jgi:maltose/moltooligosaccharide transporter
MSRIFQTLGANVDDISVYGLPPLTGLLVQPIVGYPSDNTWSPKVFGRRNLIFYWCYLASITLFIMPHSPVLWVAAGLLWILDST